jgi:hypothetical protein
MKKISPRRELNISKFDQPGAIYKIDEHRVVKRFIQEEKFPLSSFKHEKRVLTLVRNV